MKELRRYLEEVSTEMEGMKILAGPSTKEEILKTSAQKLELGWGSSPAGVAPEDVRRIIKEVAVSLSVPEPTEIK